MNITKSSTTAIIFCLISLFFMGQTSYARNQQGEVVIGGYVPSRNDHGAITGATNLDANYTEHIGTVTASFTLTAVNFTSQRPSSAFRFVVSGGGTPTITISADSSPSFWTDQTLTTLADGTYQLLLLFDGTDYDAYVIAKP